MNEPTHQKLATRCGWYYDAAQKLWHSPTMAASSAELPGLTLDFLLICTDYLRRMKPAKYSQYGAVLANEVYADNSLTADVSRLPSEATIAQRVRALEKVLGLE